MRKTLLSLMALAFVPLSACGGASAPVIDERDGPWDLKAPLSSISYLTIKAGDIAENNRFDIFVGTVEPSGEVQIDIALNSLETNIDTRDQRMKAIVFQTDKYPMATIKTKVPMSEFSDLEVGGRKNTEQEISVSLAGLEQTFDAGFMVTRLGVNEVLIEPSEPILVYADDFGFTEEIETLRQLANLESITPVVPVSFSLVFKR